ncbi:efflux RND transporter periplasmic adaptor subunit [Sandarakinorhabdus sp.]|uniref:efflux RND transporter periplasmic adaptor subunit n=1 Tax=Sandarakinorhabdus sp. TaxID=1916663 RepID=UPI00286D929F|nr:efflux RND transporter periplasmic adaptor subunit [Sandarakinorhabdus sp.]
MKVRIYIMANGYFIRAGLGIAAIAALAACGDGSDGKAGGPGGKRPPMLVAAMSAATESFAPTLLALGTVTPRQTVAVRTRADGEIMAVLFREGDFVRAGQPLFRLDDRQARAGTAQARANLASARATLVQAKGDFERAKALVGKGFISQAILDQRRALADAADAAVAAAAAQLRVAETQLSFLSVSAPVSGRTGEIGFRLGAVVRAADAAPLVTINQISPIDVRFLVPAQQIMAARAALRGNAASVTVRKQGTAPGAGAVLATGRLVFLDNNVDAGNGAVAAKAEFANGSDQLWPGAILNVELPLGQAMPHVALPESAVQTGRDTPFVWTVGKGGEVAMRPVAIAGRLAGKVYLASGVSPGEKIITDTLLRIKEGDKVRLKDGPGRAPVTAAASAPAQGKGG